VAAATRSPRTTCGTPVWLPRRPSGRAVAGEAP
jgi:hypothetical protein